MKSEKADHRILIVEDDHSIREMLQELFEMEGYQVYAAENGKLALEILAKVTPCLVLLDLMMPVMNGWEFLEIQGKSQVLASIPVVVMSAVRESIKPQSVKDFIKKPVDFDVLLDVVKQYC